MKEQLKQWVTDLRLKQRERRFSPFGNDDARTAIILFANVEWLELLSYVLHAFKLFQ